MVLIITKGNFGKHAKVGGDQPKLWEEKKPQNSEKLTAERRGAILGEKVLERSLKKPSSSVDPTVSVDVQIKLSDTFTKPASANEQADVRKPFDDDPAKQKRFEQFVKEKYEGGLRTKDSGGSVYLYEAARARKKIEFELAADAIVKEKLDRARQASEGLLKNMPASAGLQFTSGGVEPPPAPCPRSKTDSLIFMPDSIRTPNVGEQASSSLNPQVGVGNEVEG